MRAVAALLLLAATAPATDLSRIDRTIEKLPTFTGSKQFYALLAVGADAKTRIWIVVDGGDLYFDGNGNGDLTEPGEKFTTKIRNGKGRASRIASWKPGRLARIDRYTEISVGFCLLNPAWRPGRRTLFRDYLERYMELVAKTPGANLSSVLVTVAGRRRIACRGMFTTRPETAPVFHIDAPLSVGVVEEIMPFRFGRGDDPYPLHVTVGTPGYGGDQPGCFSSVQYQEFPKGAQPIAVVEFPSRVQGERLAPREYRLEGRC